MFVCPVLLGRKTFINIVIGLTTGTVAAVLLGQAVHNLLGIHFRSGVAGYLTSALLIFLIALLAVIQPARRAGRIDPMQALRIE
jgi:ABC-type antimicrobial peptide transport system permease subunit